MTVDKLSLLEPGKLAVKPKENIVRNPGHSRIEQVELEDVQELIALRHRQLRHTFVGRSRTLRTQRGNSTRSARRLELIRKKTLRFF